MTTIAIRIVEARTARGLAPHELAAAAAVAPAQLSRYESGAAIPSVQTLVRLAGALGVSLDFLAGRTDEIAAAGPETDALVRELGRLRTSEAAIVAGLVDVMNRNREVTP